ncbi:MAG: amidohydrolase [Caulobacteraceae bacterium]
MLSKTLVLAGVSLLTMSAAAAAQTPDLAAIDAKVQAGNARVVAWRRDIHQNPELGNSEVRTAKLIAAELKRMGIEVRTGVAKTGVIGVLKGGKPGAVVALRADIDALPVAEQTGLPFASKVTATYNGKTVPVMHACGHDSHTAMLLGAAEVLAGMREQIPGTIVFIFQPAEEGAPEGEEGGASRIIAEGGLSSPKPDAIIGLHVMPGPVGSIDTRTGPFFAGSDTFRITFKGKGTHGAMPWAGIDVISLSAATVQALNTIAARQLDVTESPTIITIGSLQAGTRFNVIPEVATLDGTLRTYGAERHKDAIERIERTANDLAHSYGAKAEIKWFGANPSTDNSAALTEELAPVLKSIASPGKFNGDAKRRTVSEDFSYYSNVAPTLFYTLGSTPNFKSMEASPANHSPFFQIDEAVLPVGVKTHVLTALAYLNDHAK